MHAGPPPSACTPIAAELSPPMVYELQGEDGVSGIRHRFTSAHGTNDAASAVTIDFLPAVVIPRDVTALALAPVDPQAEARCHENYEEDSHDRPIGGRVRDLNP